MTTAIANKGKTEVSTAQPESYYKPYYNVDSNEKNYEVRVYIPGVSKSGVEMSVDDDILSITGTRTDQAPEGWKALRRELSQANYRLQLQLNNEVDIEKITAKVADGVLTVHLPKSEAVKPRSIAVE